MTTTTTTEQTTPGQSRYIYRFAEGNAKMRDLLGGKGANLAEMARLGLPVPPGFTITTDTCRAYYDADRTVPQELWDDVRMHLAEVEENVGRKFGDASNPLLVSVRSGSKFSMPGMMDTILNLGLNDETVEGFARSTGDRRFALDSYRRFIQLFSKVALGLKSEGFDKVLSEVKERTGAATDADLTVEALEEVVKRYLEIVKRENEAPFPQDTWDQLRMAVLAVFDSWNSERAIAYREYSHIPHDLGTAANIMAMVFGNSGWDSGTGVTFTRDPSTGEKVLFGEYLPNAQGEDVVAGTRTPKKIAELQKEMPAVYDELHGIGQKLEQHFREMQDIEFTIEHTRLYMLQTRSAKRTANSAVRVAVDMVDEKLISKDEAVMRVPPDDLAQLLLPRFDEEAKKQAVAEGRLLGKGLNASPGAATGRAVFEVDASTAPGFIFVRPETSADDMPGILRAAAVLTSRGGITSHAAVVTRGLGKPAVVGCTELKVDARNRQMTVDGKTVNEGDEISVDGFTGEVFSGHIGTLDPDVSSNKELRTLLGWADDLKRLGVRANADTPRDAKVALDFGAKGIGLCRTEHMFFQQERLEFVRDMLMGAAETARILRDVKDARIAVEMARGSEKAAAEQAVKEAEARLDSDEAKTYRAALEKLGEYQTADFRDILRVMDGYPVVIRLLDAPLHEFLPPHEHVLQEVAALRATKPDSAELKEKEELLQATRSLQESNPMLGHRGSRLGLTYPEVYQMQVRAIVRAALDLVNEGLDPRPEVMVPLVMDVSEVQELKDHLADILEEYQRAPGKKAPLHFGTMIELPRAALVAGSIAPEVEFFSFGSNDLTQMTFGFSRDDAEEKFLSFYLETGLLPTNPFASIDQKGVGRLIEMAAEEGRAANPKLELGICGEHGGDPESIDFCNRVGLNYVSCSPMRVPIARLAAAQAALGAGDKRDV